MRLRGLLAAALALLVIAPIAGAAQASASVTRCLERTERAVVGSAVREAFRSSSPADYDDTMSIGNEC
jgi:hypothetical protein